MQWWNSIWNLFKNNKNYIHNTWQFSDIVLELFLFILNKILLSVLLDPVKTKNFYVDDEWKWILYVSAQDLFYLA